jgi:dTDP-4-dehydrorhamnose reductase
MTRVLVTGATGMLGRDMTAALSGGQYDVVGTTRADLDVTDPEATLAAVAGFDVVVNCTAWTAVDDAQSHEPEAFAVNAIGPANLARACARHGARLAHVSTDYVFAGDAKEPYPEDAPPAPRSAYGRTKAAGEWAVRAELPRGHWIVRTAWLYGEHGNNFVRTMARLERERETLDVVDDQRGQPTWSRDLADAIVSLIDVEAPTGTYHGTSSGECTWFDLAQEVFTGLGADPGRVRPTTSESYRRPAPRPAYSVLGHDGWARSGLSPIRPWKEALAEALPRLIPAL